MDQGYNAEDQAWPKVEKAGRKMLLFVQSAKRNFELGRGPPYISHSEHLVRNGVHKWYFFENISLRSLFRNYF